MRRDSVLIIADAHIKPEQAVPLSARSSVALAASVHSPSSNNGDGRDEIDIANLLHDGQHDVRRQGWVNQARPKQRA